MNLQCPTVPLVFSSISLFLHTLSYLHASSVVSTVSVSSSLSVSPCTVAFACISSSLHSLYCLFSLLQSLFLHTLLYLHIPPVIYTVSLISYSLLQSVFVSPYNFVFARIPSSLDILFSLSILTILYLHVSPVVFTVSTVSLVSSSLSMYFCICNTDVSPLVPSFPSLRSFLQSLSLHTLCIYNLTSLSQFP